MKNIGKSLSLPYVRDDFKKRGIEIGWLTRRRLASYPVPVYERLVGIVERLSRKHTIQRLKVDPAEKISQLQLEEVPDSFLVQCFKSKTMDVLDLRGLEVKWQTQQAEADRQRFLGREAVPQKLELPVQDRVRQLLKMMIAERAYFQKLTDNPEATVEKLFRALVHGIARFKELGFHATLFRPVQEEGLAPQECYWRQVYRAESWGEGTYSGTQGNFPVGTLLSVLRSRGTSFHVDLEKPETFVQQGLVFDPEKIAADLKQSKGSPELLIYKLSPSGHGAEAVVYINNRMSADALVTPSRELFPPEDADLIKEELSLYFEKVTQALRTIQYQSMAGEGPPVFGEDRGFLTPAEKKAILRSGELLEYAGQKIYLFEVPSEKFYKRGAGVINWLRDRILPVYEGTKIAEGKTKEELIKALSLENEKMLERVIFTRYLALIAGDAHNAEELKGMVSGTVIDIQKGGVGPVFRVPEAMIQRIARGRKLEVALSYEMVLRVFRKRWAEMGFIKGFFHMLFKGIPFYATTQSLRVAKDMMRLKDLSLLRIVRGKELSPEQRIVIDAGSEGKADHLGIEAGAYGGRIAIDEEEKGISLRRPFWLFDLFGLRLLFRRYLKKIERENQEIRRLFTEALGEKGRIHLVGHFTIGVAMKVGMELAFSSFLKRFRRNRAN